ncbi:MAG TPA: hypothetical protein VMX13_02530 [Sedimentisphaerales bacterium]|nr:hypothetical protein [Sedimentisphaerales bacterium]
MKLRRGLFITVSLVFVLSLAQSLVLAAPPLASATCNISCTVADIAEWSDNRLRAINLPDLTTHNEQVSHKSSLLLYTNGDVEISTDRRVSAQLSEGNNDKLVREYILEYRAAGTTTAWSNCSSLLKNDSTVKHISCDEARDATFSLTFSNDSRVFGDSDGNSDTLTLTVSWKS